jgi:hypothetical protein
MDIADLLAEHSDEIGDLARRLLDHVAAASDWADTRVFPGWHGVGFHHAELGYLVGVFPRSDSVRVLFEHGRLLGTAPFFEGSGQTRYVEFTEWDVDRVATVDEVLDRALAP